MAIGIAIVAVLVFMMLRLTPSDPAAIIAGDFANEQQIAEIRSKLGLDQPIGDILPDFASERDRRLTFRAGHVHVSGIHFPWERLGINRVSPSSTDSTSPNASSEAAGLERSLGVMMPMISCRSPWRRQ